MAEVTIHPAAEAEYETALAWYYERSPQAAERFEAAFSKRQSRYWSGRE